MIQVNVKFLPLSLTPGDAAVFVGSEKLFADMRKEKWIAPIVSRNKMTLFDRAELEKCYARVVAGQYPGEV